MKIYKLYRKQQIPVSIQAAWDYLSNPQNLSEITPPNMNFTVTSKLPEKMYAGLIITYKVSPLFSIPITWVSEITHIDEPYHFVDEQKFGPYSFWHHSHRLNQIDDGVIMEDIVHYKLPLGLIGNLFGRPLVNPRLENIFNYREKVLDKLFK
ncbi:MAG: SRPBCC family protein [Candidatus Kapaibacterium sp.]